MTSWRGAGWTPTAERVHVTGLMQALAPNEPILLYTSMAGNPHSKARPRFGKGGRAYTSAESRAAEKATGQHLKQIISGPFTGNLAMVCVFYRRTRQVIDTDNMLKHVCDAANKILWVDDSQVTALIGITEYDPDNPRTVIAIAHHLTGMRRGTDSTYPCEVCGKLIMRPHQKGVLRKTCSHACALQLKGHVDLKGNPGTCKVCGTGFVRRTSAQKLCSEKCRVDMLRDTRKKAARPYSKCLDCDAQLAHRRGGRCRTCWRNNIKASTKCPACDGIGWVYTNHPDTETGIIRLDDEDCSSCGGTGLLATKQYAGKGNGRTVVTVTDLGSAT